MNGYTQMTRLAQAIAIALLTMSLGACEGPSHQQDAHVKAWVAHNAPEREEQMPHQMRMGVTTTGKIGLEIAPGVIMTPSGPGFGIGF